MPPESNSSKGQRGAKWSLDLFGGHRRAYNGVSVETLLTDEEWSTLPSSARKKNV